MKLIFIIILLSLSYTVGFSQADSLTVRNIEIKAYAIDSELGKRISKNKFELDSIVVKTKRYKNKIQAESKFESSELELLTEYYFENGTLTLIRFTEHSLPFKKYKKAKKTTEFYYADGILLDEKVRTFFPGELHGIGIPKDVNKAFEYNKNCTSSFLKTLSDQILKRIAE